MTDIDQWLASAPQKDETPEERTMTRGQLLAQILAYQHHQMLQMAQVTAALDHITDILLSQMNEDQIHKLQSATNHRKQQDTLRRIEEDLENN